MKIVVIGGNGLIGTKVVKNLRARGHEVVSASRSSGVNTITGEGLAAALAGAQVVVDLANAPSWEDQAVLEFFQTAGRNIAAAEKAAGVKHHVALGVVGTDRLLASGYFRGKMAQEEAIKASPIPYTIIRATQFFEFVEGIVKAGTQGQTVRVSEVLMQPIVSDDVAATVTEVALAEPRNGTVELAGPEPIRIHELVRQFLAARGDARTVVTDPSAGYFGTPVDDHSLTPGANPILGPTRFADWLRRTALLVILLLSCALASASAAPQAKVTELMTKALAQGPGQEVTMLTVSYPPGAEDPVHRHNASAFVYVLEGSIVMQMQGGRKVTLHPGQTFYEDPNGVHLVGRNASKTAPAKFLVFLVKKKGAPILVPVSR